jgi:regulator of sirC expression with transglutaminase-like and TPR domain
METKNIIKELIKQRIEEIEACFPKLVKRPTKRDKEDFLHDANKMRAMIEALRKELRKREPKDVKLDEEVNVELYDFSKIKC